MVRGWVDAVHLYTNNAHLLPPIYIYIYILRESLCDLTCILVQHNVWLWPREDLVWGVIVRVFIGVISHAHRLFRTLERRWQRFQARPATVGCLCLISLFILEVKLTLPMLIWFAASFFPHVQSLIFVVAYVSFTTGKVSDTVHVLKMQLRDAYV